MGVAECQVGVGRGEGEMTYGIRRQRSALGGEGDSMV